MLKLTRTGVILLLGLLYLTMSPPAVANDLTFDDTKAKIAFNWHPTKVLDGFKI